MLKITAGTLKGRKLSSLKGKNTRPTLAKNREVIFSVLESRVRLEDYEVHDLFAGSGILGFEALSRGASGAVFVENNKKAFWTLRENVGRLSLRESCRVVFKDALAWLKKQVWEPPPKLFFLDPPYQSGLIEKAVQIMANQSYNLENGIVVAETSGDRELSYPDCLTVFQRKFFGGTKLDFAIFKPEKQNEAFYP